MSTFITRLDGAGSGPRVAVKDLIDVAGTPTTAGCRALERVATAALVDAPCLAGVRASGARIVGKANLQELAMGPLGTNQWFGTPRNPLDPALIPGGSSSGSAVAVASGDADVAIGTDTGGSVRIPAACCGVTGLKTTFGRIPVDRVWPLAPSFDTVGPLARDVAGLELAMALLEPGFHAGARPAGIVGRIRTDADPVIEAAIDDALARSEFEVVELAVPALADVAENFAAIWFHEILASDQALLASDPRGVGSLCTRILERATAHPKDIAAARRALTRWREEFDSLFARVELLALATLNIFPPRLDELGEDPVALARELVRNTRPFNAVGAPASAQPIAVTNSGVPASLQLVGPLGSEELVLASAARVESALN